MQSIATIRVNPTLPNNLKALETISRNLWWTWNPEAQALFEAINPLVWETTNHNAVRVLQEASQSDLNRVSTDENFVADLERTHQRFQRYMTLDSTWFKQHNPNFKGMVGYFCMEYGLHESLQIYSGGLGVLAGDHCKSASDLGVPFVAIGLLFRDGYFHQQLDANGWQGERYEIINPNKQPLTLARDEIGEIIKIEVEVSGRIVTVQAWRLEIGRISLYLLDTDVHENPEADKAITKRLYGKGEELRVAQELVLGVGGLRLTRALKLPITVYHMNEGHAAFLGLERLREYREAGLEWNAAIELVASSGIFTTHTPVPAGNDSFGLPLIDRKLTYWAKALKVTKEDLYALATQQQKWGPTFSMTVLALRLSRYANGVSELHGQVSRGMWSFLWDGADAPEVPIKHVTNGIHTRTFLAHELAELYDAAFPKYWDSQLENPKVWQLEKIEDNKLWEARLTLKKKLVEFTRSRLRRANERNNTAGSTHVLSETALTIGFARRFATYKRATLLFRDINRLKRIVNNPERPVQFIFAGKAHPADNPGKEFIQQLWRYSQDPDLKGKIVFLEDYDMNVARHLVQGSDIWLNNPRRPLEASGTSGEKASLNGCLNFSILDGWWREAYDGTNGWAIGDEREFNEDDESLRIQDDRDCQSLYDILEYEIAPLYYGAKHDWLERVRNGIRTVAPKFSMQRQVIDYVEDLYTPAATRAGSLTIDQAKNIAAWKTTQREGWSEVRLSASLEANNHVRARVWLGKLLAADIQIEAVVSKNGVFQRTALSLEKTHEDGWLEYTGSITMPEAGEWQLGVRAVPYRDDLSNPLEVGLLRWA
jgi:glycogen phosphorylase